MKAEKKENNLKKEFPSLNKYLRFLTPDNIGQRTLAIEKTRNKDILRDWIDFWTRYDYVQAAQIIMKLKNVTEEERESYKQILLSNVNTQTNSFVKVFRFIMIYLYFDDMESLERYLKYLRWMLGLESEDIRETEKIGPTETVKYILRKRDIKSVTSLEELEELLGKIIEKCEEFKEYLDADKKSKVEKLKSIREELKSASSYEAYIDPIINEIEPIRALKDIKWESGITKAVTAVIFRLLKDSNYKLIFKLIYEIEVCNLFYTVSKNDLARLDKAPMMVVSNIIQKTVDLMLDHNHYDYAFVFLRRIKVKDYFRFIPNDKSPMEYIQLIDKYKNHGRKTYFNFDVINVERELFIKEKYNGNNIQECLKQWLEFMKKYGQSRTAQHNELLTILEIVDNDMNCLQENFMEEEFQKLKEKASTQVISNKLIVNEWLSILEKILKEDISLDQKVSKIKLFGKINFFEYQPVYRETNAWENKIINDQDFIRNRIKNIFIELLENCSQDDLEAILSLYMNSPAKYDIPLEYVISRLLEKKLQNVLQVVNRYVFYASVVRMKRSVLFEDYRIINVKTKNRARCFTSIQFRQENILRIKITNYSKTYDRLEVEPIKEVSSYMSQQAKEKLEKNFGLYKEAYQKHDLKILSDDTIVFHEKSFKRLAHLQIEILEEFNNENAICLLEDKINPFSLKTTFRFYKSYKEKVVSIKNIMDSEKQKVKNSYADKVRAIYKRMFADETIYLNYIIYSYMNTVAKYYLNFDEFVYMLANRIRKKNEETIDIKRYFSEYDMFCEHIDKNKIVNSYPINGNNLVATKECFVENLCYYTFKIKEYNFSKNEIIVEDIMLDNRKGKNSRNYQKLMEILRLYLYSESNPSNVLKKLKKMDTIEEFKKLNYVVSRNLLFDYEKIYKEIIVKKLSNKMDELIEFIECLGDNNYWKYKQYTGNNGRWQKNNIDNLTIKNTFLKLVKEVDFRKVIFIYQNTFIKEVVSLDELFNKIFKFNIFHNWKIDENNMVDLSEFHIPIETTNIKQSEEEGVYILKNSSNSVELKVKIEGTKLDLEANTQGKLTRLMITKYDLKNNIIYCYVEYFRTLKDEKYQYLIEYLYVLSSMLKKDDSIDYIYDYVRSSSVILENAYYYKTLTNKYFTRDFNAEACQEILKQLLERYGAFLTAKIKKYILTHLESGEIHAGNINKVFFIYDKTILRYIISIHEFVSYFAEIINANKNILNLYIKFKINEFTVSQNASTDLRGKIYIHRYSQLLEARLINTNKIDIQVQQNYIGRIYKFDTERNMISFNNLAALSLGEVGILEDITKNVSNDEELIDLIDTQIRNIYKLTVNIIQQMRVEKRLETIFLNSYLPEEKKKLEHLKELTVELFADRKDAIKEGFEKLLKRTAPEDLKHIVNYYMNTAIRYIFSIQDFIELLFAYFPDVWEEEEGMVNIGHIFLLYKIPVDKLIDGNHIQSPLFGDDSQIIINNEALAIGQDKDITQGRIKIEKYDKEKRAVVAQKIIFRTDIET